MTTTEPITLREVTDALRDHTQKLMKAGLGAVVVAQEEGTRQYRALAEKGARTDVPLRTAAEQRMTGLYEQAQAVVEAVQTRIDETRFIASEAAAKTERTVRETANAVLHRLGVPTRDELHELTMSVERLVANLEALDAKRVAPAVAPLPVAAPTLLDEPVATIDAATTEQTVSALEAVAVGGGWYEIRRGEEVVEKVQGKARADEALARWQG